MFHTVVSCEEDPLLLHVHEANHDFDVQRTDYALLCSTRLLFEDGSSHWPRGRSLCEPCCPVTSFDPQDALPCGVLSFLLSEPPSVRSVWPSL